MMPDDTEVSVRKRRFEPARRRFPRRFDALSSLFGFSAVFYAANDVGGDTKSTADFVLEELFTNVVKYNAGGAGEIEVDLRRDEEALEISLTDFDSDRFDPREAGEVAVDAPLDGRTPGGLGIHLVRKLAKRVDYDYVERRSKVTICLEME